MVRSHGSCCWEEMRGESLEMCQAQPGEYEVRKLYASRCAPVTTGYVQPVPDQCDRITWRGSYYHLPLEQLAPVVVEQNKINHLKQLLRNVRATLHFSPEDLLAIDAALREDGE